MYRASYVSPYMYTCMLLCGHWCASSGCSLSDLLHRCAVCMWARLRRCEGLFLLCQPRRLPCCTACSPLLFVVPPANCLLAPLLLGHAMCPAVDGVMVSGMRRSPRAGVVCSGCGPGYDHQCGMAASSSMGSAFQKCSTVSEHGRAGVGAAHWRSPFTVRCCAGVVRWT